MPPTTMDPSRPLAGPERRRALYGEATAVIQRSYGDFDLSVDTLAQEVFSSRRQLQRAFTEAGTTVRGYVFDVRMERAAELMSDGDIAIGDVGRAVGCRHPAQSAKAFARRYGVPPSRLQG